LAEKETVLLKVYDLLLYIIPQLEKFPRSQKFLLADRIQTKILDVLETSIAAYYGQRTEKLPLLKEMNISLEQLRYLVRLSHDLKLFNKDRYALVSQRVDEIGKMVGGWSKSLTSP
jgi:hypothetical protein